MKISDCGKYTIVVGEVKHFIIMIKLIQNEHTICLIHWQSEKKKILHKASSK